MKERIRMNMAKKGKFLVVMLGIILGCIGLTEKVSVKADEYLQFGEETYLNGQKFYISETCKVQIEQDGEKAEQPIWAIDMYTGEKTQIGRTYGRIYITTLPKGLYQIGYGSNGGYKGKITCQPINPDIDEVEYNDTLDTAQLINTNIMYTASTRYSDDDDYYKIILEEQGSIDIEVFNDNLYACVQLFSEDADLNVIEIMKMNESGYIKSNKFRLPAGIYYLKINQMYIYSFGREYRFKVNYTEESSDAFETEEYSTGKYLAEHLNGIKTNQTYTGNLQTSTDVDYYAFYVDSSSRVQLKFVQPRGTKAETYQVRLYYKDDENDDEVNIEKLTTDTNPVYYSEQVVLKQGWYYVEVKSDSYSDETSYIDYKILVNEDPIKLVENIEISADAKAFYVGNSYSMKANVSPEDAEDISVTWASSDRTIAKVDQNGKVTCVGEGSCYIYAKAQDGSNVKGKYQLTVKKNLVKKIVLKASKKTYYTGTTFTLSTTITPSTATDRTVTWGTSNAKIATVNSAGKVTCIAPGTCYIYAMANDGSDVSAEYKVTVKKNTINTLSKVTINTGMMSPAYDKNVTDYTITLPKNTSKVTIIWKRSSTTETVTLNGKVASKTTVSVAAGKSKEVQVTVKAESGAKKVYTFKIIREK